MKILQLDSEMTWRGGQNQVFLLINGLAERGIECHLASPKHSALTSKIGQTIPVFTFPKLGLFNYVSVARQLATYCKQHDISIIDAHSSKAHTLGLLIKRFYNRPIFLVHRRVDYVPGHHPINAWKYKSNDVAGYICISNAIQKILLDWGIPRQKLHTAHSAATPTVYHFKDKSLAKQTICQKYNISLDKTLMLCSAALTEQKDHHTLLKAIAKSKYRNKCYLLLAGEGHLKSELMQLCKDLMLDSCVKFLGFCSDIHDLMQAADIFVMSSRYEGLGTSILDAMQARCIVVATNVGGIPEMIQPSITGYLAEKENPETLQQQLDFAIDSQSAWTEILDNAKNKIAIEFSANAMCNKNLEIYKHYLNQ